MGARILKLPLVAASALDGDGVANRDASRRFLFWHGASGRRYVHTVYSLLECPELPPSNYVLAKHDAEGTRTALRIGRVTNAAPSLNLAEIRRMAADLGADEVHIHLLAGDTKQARLVEFDLRAGQFDALSAEPASPVLH